MTPPLLGLALALTLVAPAPNAERSETRSLPFISDDYPRALAQARSRDVPLFIEAWAPW
jgi:hypothetical protein